jgi:hypothetical protein
MRLRTWFSFPRGRGSTASREVIGADGVSAASLSRGCAPGSPSRVPRSGYLERVARRQRPIVLSISRGGHGSDERVFSTDHTSSDSAERVRRRRGGEDDWQRLAERRALHAACRRLDSHRCHRGCDRGHRAAHRGADAEVTAVPARARVVDGFAGADRREQLPQPTARAVVGCRAKFMPLGR